jgi:hypothetical protein
MMQKTVIGILLSATPLWAAPAAAQHAHVHGHAKVNVVVEGRTATIEVIAPADGIYGFERAPRNAAERQQRESGLRQLRERISEMVIFEADRGCRFSVARLDDSTSGGRGHARGRGHSHASVSAAHPDEHREVHAEYSVACQRPLSGSQLRFGVGRVFPGIRELDVQLISERGQNGLKIVRDRGSVRL